MARASLLLAGALLALGTPAFAQVTAFTGARVIDGRGAVIERGTVVVRDGRIEAVGPADRVAVPGGATRVDVTGRTLMPGLVNAHGHLSPVDGFRTSPQLYTRDNLERQLRAYATYGVTTVFSLGDDQADAFALRAEQATAPPARARVFVGGPIVYTDTAEAARTATDAVIALRPDLIKVRVDDNLGSSKKMPEAAWRATLDRAKAAGLTLAAHIFYLADARAIAEAGNAFIAHSVRDLPVDDAFLAFFRRGYGEAVAAEMRDAGRQAKFRASPGWAQGQKYKAGLEVAKANLKRVHDAGIRIAFGTDSGPAGRFQGYFEHLELEMMVQAGLTPMQALVSATGNAAACWGKTGQLGTLVPGAAADLLVLAKNPLDDIRHTRTIESIYIGGRPFTPPPVR
jgi:imidazolonepropionase-like amidohydrolase